MADWTGFRPDSAPAIEGGERIIAWWKQRGRDPREKLLIFSDGLDVDMIEEAYLHFDGKVRMAEKGAFDGVDAAHNLMARHTRQR